MLPISAIPAPSALSALASHPKSDGAHVNAAGEFLLYYGAADKFIGVAHSVLTPTPNSDN